MKTIAKIILIVLIQVYANQASAQEQSVAEKDGPFTKMLLFKWNERITDHQKTEMVRLFEDLVQEVDGLDYFEVEKITYSQRFETCFVLKFSSVAAEKLYVEHPKHQQLASLGPLLVKDFQEFKY